MLSMAIRTSDRLMHTKDGEAVKWELIKVGRPHPRESPRNTANEIIIPLYLAAREHGYNPSTPLEAIFMLKKTPAEALHILTEIYKLNGYSQEKAE